MVSLISRVKWYCTIWSGAILADNLLSVELMYNLLREFQLPHASVMHELHCDLIPFTCIAGLTVSQK